MHELTPMFFIISSSKLPPMFPMFVGIHPWRLRLAITITEAGEFPMFIGMHPVNSLSFRKTASRFFSKIDAGIWPVNLLKRRSKYLNVGSSRISVGNGPENSLLLASNSCKYL